MCWELHTHAKTRVARAVASAEATTTVMCISLHYAMDASLAKEARAALVNL